MAIQHWTENVILVDLPHEPEMGDELQTVTEMVSERDDCDVVIDFSGVDNITSCTLSELLELRKPLVECGRRLVLCGLAAAIQNIFIVTSLDKVFELADDKFIALATLEMIG